MGNNWRIRKFSDLCEISRGSSPRPINDWLSETGIPWLKIADATKSNSRFVKETKQFIKDDDSFKGVRVFPGDLVLTNSATPGLPKIIDFEGCIHDGWLLFRDFQNLDKLFAYYLLLYERRRIVQKASGTVFSNLKIDILRNHEILLPPLPEQRAIAGVLSALDDKIDLLHRQNETLEALAQTLFRQWFVEEAEDDWEVGVIPDEFDFTMGLSPPGTSYNEEAIGTPMFQGNADFTFRFPRRRVFTTDPRRFAEKFDTLISVRAPVGAQNMALERCCIGRGVAAFRYKRNSQYFSYTYNKLNSIMAEIRQFEDSGTVFGSINKSDFESLEIIIPPTELVDKFEYEVSPLDEKIYRNCLQIRTLEKLRDMLLPKLMSGEVRVVRS